ncbi:hypothetical protein HanXRQr2_Chr04g0180481 [Helianthus annuus]|uniref:Uncharacterized protein n=1 Tax=Helianthus annuus TaxID=4232 RepID=A0A9K3NU16_HELAN|nr:hypothetical protein HanXRQr2_Chr04g0180481 [Helianthus annuus]KAJ0932463.1 hypothetical protein HanPSC8_Chr04g0173901 [Helianthus annuus]
MQPTLIIILPFVAKIVFDHLHPHSYFIHKALIFFFLLEFTSKLVKSEGSSV